MKALSPRTGRPKVDNKKDIRFSIRLDADINNALESYCENHNEIKAEVIRKAIVSFLESN